MNTVLDRNFPSGSRGKGAPKSHRAVQSPPNPFKPFLSSPKKSPGGSNWKTRNQNAAVMSQNAPGKQLTPINGGKSEFRMGTNKRQGFAAISRKYREPATVNE